MEDFIHNKWILIPPYGYMLNIFESASAASDIRELQVQLCNGGHYLEQESNFLTQIHALVN